MPTVPGETVQEAYKVVEQMLTGAVGDAPSAEAFQTNLQFCQIVAQRMLAVLIFNAAKNNNTTADQALEKVGMGIKRELNDMIEASKDEKNMSTIQVDFDKNKELPQ